MYIHVVIPNISMLQITKKIGAVVKCLQGEKHLSYVGHTAMLILFHISGHQTYKHSEIRYNTKNMERPEV